MFIRGFRCVIVIFREMLRRLVKFFREWFIGVLVYFEIFSDDFSFVSYVVLF